MIDHVSVGVRDLACAISTAIEIEAVTFLSRAGATEQRAER